MGTDSGGSAGDVIIVESMAYAARLFTELHAMLKDPYYVGFLVYKGDVYPGRHEPLIGQDLFDQVQEVMSARSGAGTRDRVHNHYLKGMLFCHECHAHGRESRMIYVQAKGRSGSIHEYFFCRAKQEGLCATKYIPSYVIEECVVDEYARLKLETTFEADIRNRLTKALDSEQEDIKATYAALRNQLSEIE